MQDPKTGLFEKKWLILTVLEGEKSGKAGKEAPLGRVVINLADYVAEDDKATMAFTVAANQAVSAEVGECKLLVTLGSISTRHFPSKAITNNEFDPEKS